MWNIYSFLYLFVALSPFIIISSIVMISVFMHDVKGIIFLSGLILTMFLNWFLIFNRIPDFYTNPSDKLAVCKLSFMELGDEPGIASSFPKSTIINAYTFGYFSYCISQNNTNSSNGTMIAFFVLLIIGDFAFNFINNCAGTNLFLALFYGLFAGVIWAAIIGSGGNKNLYFFQDGGTTSDKCSNTNQKFACTVTRNGQVL